ncbi:uncharacterized protein CLUP02_05461 [Colletotrichum lupini]|uniref:Uncharacterized protein n=1 Tax=Colletotrichum lupini TaxID=145971 RepID=A0A9Q8SML0_9PEZI|nr:uncharacterized protein CLUP02_05461 [Colletotrichum lupini]UQC79980.1 hypothetical protein CLUP02_05461 [Colletotrichum lupini]
MPAPRPRYRRSAAHPNLHYPAYPTESSWVSRWGAYHSLASPAFTPESISLDLSVIDIEV